MLILLSQKNAIDNEKFWDRANATCHESVETLESCNVFQYTNHVNYWLFTNEMWPIEIVSIQGFEF